MLSGESQQIKGADTGKLWLIKVSVSLQVFWRVLNLAVLLVAKFHELAKSHIHIDPELLESSMSYLYRSLLILYQYDPLDRLSSHDLLDGRVCRRFYKENNLITELQREEQLSIIRHEDHLLAQQRRSASGAYTALLASDQQRSVLCTLQKGQQRSFAYTAYGYLPFENGLTRLLGFTGQPADPVTGHYLLGNGYRSYNPVLMRFNSPDSLSPFGKGGLNAYCYCGGDPTNRIDMTGHFWNSVRRFFSRLFSSSSAAKPAAIPKLVTKDVEAMMFARDANLFFDTYKGTPRITISGHGSRLGYFKLSMFKPVTPKQLITKIEAQGVKFSDYKNIRLISCYGADVPSRFFSRQSTSFAQRLVDNTGVPVKAYHGVVNALDGPIKKGAGRHPTTFSILKEPWGNSIYSPERFEPKKIRQAP